MKLRMKVCFVSLAKPCSVLRFLRCCSRQVLCFWDVLCETREKRCEILSNWLRLMDTTLSYVTEMDKRALCQRLTWLLARDHMKSKPNVFLRRLSSKIPRFLKHSTPTQLTTAIPARHHVTVNPKCPTTARLRRTVIRLYPFCDVQHDSDGPLTVMGIGRFNPKHLPFCLFLFVGEIVRNLPR